MYSLYTLTDHQYNTRVWGHSCRRLQTHWTVMYFTLFYLFRTFYFSFLIGPSSPCLAVFHCSGHLCWFTVKSVRIICNPTTVKLLVDSCAPFYGVAFPAHILPYIQQGLPSSTERGGGWRERKKKNINFPLQRISIDNTALSFQWYFVVFDWDAALPPAVYGLRGLSWIYPGKIMILGHVYIWVAPRSLWIEPFS